MNVRHLPIVQQWDCHTCGKCCREYEVAVTFEEKQRLEAQGWTREELGGQAPVTRKSLWSDEWLLSQRPTGECIFLSPENRCRIHERHGAAAKPFPCRLYPFVLVPAGDHWRVSVRLSCPTSASNQGRPVTEQTPEVQALARELEKRDLSGGVPPPPALQRGQELDWARLLRLNRTVADILGNAERPLEWRWRQVLALTALGRQTRLAGLEGRRFDDFLEVMVPALADEIPARAEDVPTPGWVGRVLFRQLAGVHARADRGIYRGVAARGRLALLWAGWCFARGVGRVPAVNNLLGNVTFAELEKPAGPLSPEAQEVLERYYQIKVTALQFCGAAKFGVGYWEGLEMLALTYPIIRWLVRGLRDRPPRAAAGLATGIVDDHFGYNRQLVGGRYLTALRLLVSQRELPKLVAWYSR